MTPFYALTDPLRSLLVLWMLLLCCGGIAGAVLSAAAKQARYTVLSVAVFVPSFFLWQAALALRGFDENMPGVILRTGALPWLLPVSAQVLLTAVTVFIVTRSIRTVRTTITPLSIKRCADQMPCGLCYRRDNGHVIFANSCMNRFCLDLTGSPPTNGNRLHDAAPEGIVSAGGRTWNVVCRDLTLDGEPLREMLAWDVTSIYEKTKALRRDNEELARINASLRAYSLKIDDIVRREEILRAKVSIHDEMNRLMLSTVAMDPEDDERTRSVLEMWERNALLLGMQAEEKREESAVEQLRSLAGTLGLRLELNEELPAALTDQRRELFFAAAGEAVINAVKHGAAQSMRVLFAETEHELCCRFENDGTIPEAEPRFTGGLANLALTAGECGAVVSAEVGEAFALTLRFKNIPEIRRSADAGRARVE